MYLKTSHLEAEDLGWYNVFNMLENLSSRLVWKVDTPTNPHNWWTRAADWNKKSQYLHRLMTRETKLVYTNSTARQNYHLSRKLKWNWFAIKDLNLLQQFIWQLNVKSKSGGIKSCQFAECESLGLYNAMHGV